VSAPTELLLRGWLAERRRLRPSAVAGNRLAVLAILVLDGSRTPTQLSRGTGITSGGLTPVLDGLEDDGYLERQANPADRRSHVVVVSQAGREALGRSLRSVEARVERALRALDDDGKRQAAQEFLDAFADAEAEDASPAR
jgi:DNA-binding MarR family transcriptional regulator